MTVPIPTVTLNNGVQMPILGFGVFQIPADQTERALTQPPDTGIWTPPPPTATRRSCCAGSPSATSWPSPSRSTPSGWNLDIFDFTLTDGQMAQIAAMDTGTTLFFDHRDPAMVSLIGNRPIHD